MLNSVDDVLAHAGIYDPAARRERYLRNRQLKGRKPGATIDKKDDPRFNNESGIKEDTSNGPKLIGKNKQAASTARQAAALKSRLASLRAELKKLLADAGSSSSSSSTSSSSSKSGGSSKTSSKPKTAKQKQAARESLKEAQKERAKEADKKPEKKDEPTKEERIAHLRSVIKDVESKLRAVLDKARTQTASNGR